MSLSSRLLSFPIGVSRCCLHARISAIDESTRAPLILQVVLGLDAAAVASAFRIAPGTMGQRLAQAKNKIRQAGLPVRVPEREEWPGRLAAVLDAIHAVFAVSETNPVGAVIAGRELAGEAMSLARLVTELLPDEPEALGLLALMLHAEARRHARRTSRGDNVSLAEQDVSLWDVSIIGEAESLLARARELGAVGRYQLEAAIQSAHVHRRLSGVNNWEQVLALYDALWAITGSPAVASRRALAVAEAQGIPAALAANQKTVNRARLRAGLSSRWESAISRVLYKPILVAITSWYGRLGGSIHLVRWVLRPSGRGRVGHSGSASLEPSRARFAAGPAHACSRES